MLRQLPVGALHRDDRQFRASASLMSVCTIARWRVPETKPRHAVPNVRAGSRCHRSRPAGRQDYCAHMSRLPSRVLPVAAIIVTRSPPAHRPIGHRDLPVLRELNCRAKFVVDRMAMIAP